MKEKYSSFENSPASVILNKKTWTDGNGRTLDPMTEMEESHIRNVLHFIYLKRAFFLMQASTYYIREFTPDRFFEEVIKKSILWNTLLEALEIPKDREIVFYDSLAKMGDYHE